MIDGELEHLAVDSIDGSACGGRIGPRLFIYLVLAYLLVAFCCWREVRYASAGVETSGDVVFVEPGPKQSQRVRFEFQDPETGHLRHNTVNIGGASPPQADAVAIQVIPGPDGSSRLKSQARPLLVYVFAGINAILLAATIALCGWWALEANTKPLTRQQRAVARRRQRSHLT